MNQQTHDLIKHIAKLEREILEARTKYHETKARHKSVVRQLSENYHDKQGKRFEELNFKIDELLDITGQLKMEEVPNEKV